MVIVKAAILDITSIIIMGALPCQLTVYKLILSEFVANATLDILFSINNAGLTSLIANHLILLHHYVHNACKGTI